MTVPNSRPARDAAAMLALLVDEGYRVTFTQHTSSRGYVLGQGYLVDLTGPLGSQAAGAGESLADALASVWPLHDELPALRPAGDSELADATAAAILAGKITGLREHVGRMLADPKAGRAGALERVAVELDAVSVILAAATEGDDEDDDAEPYCTVCGQWAAMFHGLAGWRHFRGDPAPGGKRELYDAGHEASVAWTVPAGRALSPADLRVIGEALADAHASQWCRDGAAADRAAAYVALLDRMAATGNQ
jgi:hypothetical protein